MYKYSKTKYINKQNEHKALTGGSAFARAKEGADDIWKRCITVLPPKLPVQLTFPGLAAENAGEERLTRTCLLSL